MKTKTFELINSKAPLEGIGKYLWRLKAQETQKTTVYQALEELRSEIKHDVQKEDRVLEVMDIVAGYGSPH